jgi:apolipoprotein N-acyltransferase
MPKREILLQSALAILSAALLVVIFPKFDLRFLAPVALTPLLIVLARTPNGGQRFIYGWGAGMIYWFSLCTWIQFVLEVHGGMGRWGGWGSFLLFCILKSLHLALFSYLAGPLLGRPYALPAVAALWIGLERTHGTFGFAWLALGNAGIDMSVPLRLAPFVGVYGLSFVFCMLSAAAALVILRRPRIYLAPLALLPLLYLLPAIPQGIPTTDEALVVQPNIDPEIEWTPDLQTRAEEHLSLLSSTFPAPLVIWPELPAPLYYYSDPVLHTEAAKIARDHGYFLFDTVSFTEKHEPLNSAVVLGPQGTEIGRYDQMFLVPFGEFTPPLFSFVNRITHESGDFVPGDKITVTPAAGHRLGVFICYESAFPHLVRQFSKAGADVFVNLSNDGYFGHSEARQQHLLLVRMRAVENRRYIIRATNDGITAVLDPAGRIVKALPPYRELASLVRYGAVETTTFYARHGDWFAWGCLVVTCSLAARLLWRANRESRSTVAGQA